VKRVAHIKTDGEEEERGEKSVCDNTANSRLTGLRSSSTVLERVWGRSLQQGSPALCWAISQKVLKNFIFLNAF